MRGFTRALGDITLNSLKNHDFTRGLSDAQLDFLAGLATEVTFHADEVILLDGQRSRSIYLLTSGSVSVALHTGSFVVAVESLGPGQMFGWSALLDQQDTLFEVRAREDTTALKIDGEQLKRSCQSDPKLGVEILRRSLQVVARRVKATEIRFAEMCGVKL